MMTLAGVGVFVAVSGVTACRSSIARWLTVGWGSPIPTITRSASLDCGDEGNHCADGKLAEHIIGCLAWGIGR